MSAQVTVAVVGASGYTGLELLRLLARHPHVRLAALTSREYQGRPVGQVFPALAGIVHQEFIPPDPEEVARRARFAFTAVPHRSALEMVPRLLAAGMRVVDLSADFRFRDPGVYEAWYQPHTAPELLEEAVYGLPELHRQRLATARLVGNPGCYPTAVVLGLAPLVRARRVELHTLIADCKSGVSGAGRGASLATSFCEVADSFRAYKVFEHRHTPEMEQELSLLAGEPVRLTFTPHLVPMNRGILATLYATLTSPATEAELYGLYEGFYRDEPFVRMMPPGTLPTTAQVRGTNFCDLALRVHPAGDRVVVVAAIDNLGRGAAAQAVCNFNLMAGFPETTGLDGPPLVP